jgi:hypothetical protein
MASRKHRRDDKTPLGLFLVGIRGWDICVPFDASVDVIDARYPDAFRHSGGRQPPRFRERRSDIWVDEYSGCNGSLTALAQTWIPSGDSRVFRTALSRTANHTGSGMTERPWRPASEKTMCPEFSHCPRRSSVSVKNPPEGVMRRLLHLRGGSYLIRRASMSAISRLAKSSVMNHS